jgi:hypothetical protein
LSPPVLPRWARAADYLSLLIVLIAIVIAASGGVRIKYGDWRFTMTSPYRLIVWAAAIALVRYAFARQQPIYRHLPPAISRWVRSTPFRAAANAMDLGLVAILIVARPLLLAAVGREPPDPTPVRVDAPADLGLAGADRLTGSGRSGAGLTQNEHRRGEVSEKCGRWRVRRPECRSPWRGLEVTTEATGTFELEQSSRCRIWPSWEAKSEMSA